MSGHRLLTGGSVLVLDGGTGSELRRRGATLSAVCWSAPANLARPSLLQAIHRDYIAAGADIVTANTFATTRFVLAAAGLDDRFEEINRAAVGAASRAVAEAGGGVRVAASLSCLPPGMSTDAYPPPAAESSAYLELAECLAASGAELILLEMLQHPAHAERACRAARAVGLPFVAGLSCRRAGTSASDRGPAAGVTPRLVGFDDSTAVFDEVVAAVLAFSPDAVAIMHSPLDAMCPALERLRTSWSGAVAAYAELPYAEDPDAAGAARAAGASMRHAGPAACEPAAYADAAREWIARGASVVGGCCGTGPGHIAALRRLVDSGREPV